MAVTFTQTDAAALRRALAGLNPRAAADGRPTAQETYECLAQLAEKANRAIHGVPVKLRDDQRASLRQLVDDLYRVEAQPGPPVACMGWDYRQVPDLDELTRIVAEVSGGSLYLREVDDGSDEVVIAVSRRPLDDAEALAAWEASE